jgi:hypothetical protein
VLRGIFGPKGDEVTGEWRKCHNEEIHNLIFLTQYCAGDEIEKNEIGGVCTSELGGGRHV